MCASTSRVHRLRPAKARDVVAHRARPLRCLSWPQHAALLLGVQREPMGQHLMRQHARTRHARARGAAAMASRRCRTPIMSAPRLRTGAACCRSNEFQLGLNCFLVRTRPRGTHQSHAVARSELSNMQ